MTTYAVYVVIPLVCAVMVVVVTARWERLRRSSLSERLHRADHQLAVAARQARIDMNVAAGQAWRNLAE